MTNGRCRMHGGVVPVGMASPNWKHGRNSLYGKALPARLAEDFAQALETADPLALLEEISLARTLVSQALDSWERGASGAAYKEVKQHLATLRTAIELEDKKEAWRAIRDAQEALSAAEAASAATERTLKALDGLRKLVDTSARVMDMRANSFTRHQALALQARLVELIAANVRDPQDRRRLLTALAHLEGEVAPAHSLVEGTNLRGASPHQIVGKGRE